ncbi:peptidoglycan-binding domain-containing protein [Prosthecomicrobium sp. N25]|uniref:peptidoglycan-binding domain-containing protein n=1 Tax=Prosthecomicrobium sp. N25 TaxID=3129254 RepID=UPI003077D51A
MSVGLLKTGQLLSVGSRGAEVMRVQRLLNLYPPSAFPDLKPDGIFGERTRKRVVEFQTNVGLRADGIVGPVTVRALCMTLPEMRAFAESYRQIIEEAGAGGEQLAVYDRQINANMNALTPVAAVQVVVVVGLVLAVIIVFYIAMLNLLPEHQRAHREFAKVVERKIDELREILNLPTPLEAAKSIVENVRETVKEFIETLKRNRLNCNQTPEKLLECQKESMAVAVATQNLLHKLEQLTFIGSRGFKLDDLLTGILVSVAALVKAYSDLGRCLECDHIIF